LTRPAEWRHISMFHQAHSSLLNVGGEMVRVAVLGFDI
jgi:hypothetical protein